MKTRKHQIGQIDGRPVWEVCLASDSKMEVTLISYGAAVRRICLPGPEKTPVNIALGFESLEDYIGNPLFAGAALCPCAGRISGASLAVDGQTFHLSENDNGNNLHGGFHCASHRVWTLESTTSGERECSATFSVRMADGEDGFPGNRFVKICYTLRNQSELELSFWAATDLPTYLNLSSHSYFNLSGNFHRSALKQTLQIFGNRYAANDSGHLPTAVLPCENTPFDFTRPVSLEEQINAWPGDPQLANALGYNNAFLLNRAADPDTGLREALVLSDTSSGRRLTLWTDAPCVVLYSGGYIGNGFRLDGGALSSPSCAIALEAQDFPNAPNFAPETCSFLRPGQCYRRRIVYKFDWPR